MTSLEVREASKHLPLRIVVLDGFSARDLLLGDAKIVQELGALDQRCLTQP
jgi:hypothetical protein